MTVEYGAVYTTERVTTSDICYFVFPSSTEFFYFCGHALGDNMAIDTLSRGWSPEDHYSGWTLCLEKEYT